MRFVHDQGKPPARQTANLLRDDGELLQCGYDDRLAGFERILELPRSGVDVFDNAQCLLKLTHRRLQLPVQHAPVGDHDDGVEDAAIIGAVAG